MTLGGYIKDFRTTHNLSMDDFAQRSGLSKAYVSILERNYNPSTKRAAIPSLNTIKRVANSTGLEFNDLLMLLDDNYARFKGDCNVKISSTSERLKQLMSERNLRQIDILNAAAPFCVKYGVKLGKNDLSQYVSGKVEPGQWKLTILGLALNVSEVWLMGFDVPREREMKCNYSTIPLSSPIELSQIEKEIILAYRQADALDQRLVLRTLKIDVDTGKNAEVDAG